MRARYIFDVALAPLWQLVLCTSAAGGLYKPAACAAGKFLGFEDRKDTGKSIRFTENLRASPPALLISHLPGRLSAWSAGVHLHMVVIEMHGHPNRHHICMCMHRHADSRTARDSTAQHGTARMHGWHRPSRRPPPPPSTNRTRASPPPPPLVAADPARDAPRCRDWSKLVKTGRNWPMQSALLLAAASLVGGRRRGIP